MSDLFENFDSPEDYENWMAGLDDYSYDNEQRDTANYHIPLYADWE